ncbi:MAG: DUF4214 domain-containing protein [Candidatus Aminicenantes bacterium]|nr:DUF4214 domain-containing protein [Candidatus Aminicenantes bacterium]
MVHWNGATVKNLFKKSGNQGRSDSAFLKKIYRKLLGRDTDPEGKKYYLRFLEQGRSRIDVVLDIIESEEFKNKTARENLHHLYLPSIRNEKPDQYKQGQDFLENSPIWVFQVRDDSDFDWLEEKIIQNGYYEKPGVWNFEINEDTKILSDLTSQFDPECVLDLGCANGTVMKCLHDAGIQSDGIEISRLYSSKAFPEIKENIIIADILDVDLEKKYDFILGLDIFEHLNPNKLSLYIQKIFKLLTKSGHLFCNIPAFGKDEVFGEIFPIYIKEWKKDLKKNNLFHTIHTDDYGYPKNGHLINAGSGWWVNQFQAQGFRREKDTEKNLHSKYDKAMEKISTARKSYYLFSKNPKKASTLK